jgi:hypothetical protein
MNDITTLACWGTSKSDTLWQAWMTYMKTKSVELGAPLTHFGLRSPSVKSKHVRDISLESRIKKQVWNEGIICLEGYSLPEHFRTAIFDRMLYFCRTHSEIMVCADAEHSLALIENVRDTLSELEVFCRYDRAELFVVGENEVPSLYVRGLSKVIEFKKFILLEEF